MSTTAASLRRVGLALAVALVVLATTLWWLRTDPNGSQSPRAESPTPAPECGPLLREPTGGAGAHVDSPTYDTAPPAFGDHAPTWEVRAQPFYDVESRPDVSVLVHNLEHGYNILWYDQTVVQDGDALAHVQQIADRYATLDRSPDPSTAFIAVPWTDADGGPFPDGMHYALTHWYADPADRTRSRADEAGLTRYCSGISAEIVHQWMTDHPLREAPEGYPDLM